MNGSVLEESTLFRGVPAEELHELLRKTRHQIRCFEKGELLSYHGIARKAAFWLLLRARQGESPTVNIPGSFSKWALLMNVSRPSLHRELKKLEAQGIISLEPPVIRILKPHALEEVLST